MVSRQTLHLYVSASPWDVPDIERLQGRKASFVTSEGPSRGARRQSADERLFEVGKWVASMLTTRGRLCTTRTESIVDESRGQVRGPEVVGHPRTRSGQEGGKR